MCNSILNRINKETLNVIPNICVSVAFSGAAAIIAKEIYDLSVDVVNAQHSFPYVKVASYVFGVVACIYVCERFSGLFKFTSNTAIDTYKKKYETREIVAFHPGENKVND